MRVIHKDGRVGTVVLVGTIGKESWRVSFVRVNQDNGPSDLWFTSNIRPLGPIEAELISSRLIDFDVGLDCDGWTDATCELWSDCRDTFDDDEAGRGAEADSEALEACERILEQHGVVL